MNRHASVLVTLLLKEKSGSIPEHAIPFIQKDEPVVPARGRLSETYQSKTRTVLETFRGGMNDKNL